MNPKSQLPSPDPSPNAIACFNCNYVVVVFTDVAVAVAVKRKGKCAKVPLECEFEHQLGAPQKEDRFQFDIKYQNGFELNN